MTIKINYFLKVNYFFNKKKKLNKKTHKIARQNHIINKSMLAKSILKNLTCLFIYLRTLVLLFKIKLIYDFKLEIIQN